jgi:hypothetical protein
MSKKSNATRTISLALNFNNENQYYFTVELPPKTDTDEVWYLTGENSIGRTFELEGLGRALMRLLVQLDHATKKKPRRDLYLPGFWRIHAPPKKRRKAAKRAEVTAVKENQPPAEGLVPAAGVALAE